MAYITGSLFGYHYEDKACLLKGAICAEGVSFLGATSTEGMTGLSADGILVLAPTTDDNSELLVNELYIQGAIDERVFSLLIGAENHPSMFTIGGFNSEYSKDEI